jgi:hypothetical protein
MARRTFHIPVARKSPADGKCSYAHLAAWRGSDWYAARAQRQCDRSGQWEQVSDALLVIVRRTRSEVARHA